jgi:hypothetical protein
VWNVLRRLGLGDRAHHFKGCRYALWKNPEDLTDRQANKLAWIAKHNNQLYRAYLLKEQLRLVFAHRGTEAVTILDAWLAWAPRSQIPAFVELYHRIKTDREVAALQSERDALLEAQPRAVAGSPRRGPRPRP